jgi:hypothetical protein
MIIILMTIIYNRNMFILPATDVYFQVPDAQYECLVQAKNRYGWSEASRWQAYKTFFPLLNK